jgi:serine/threonine protein phosphatase 1
VNRPIIAIGDIHGEAGKLDRLLARLPLADKPQLVFLGDYIDRGPDSRAVVDTVRGLVAEGAVALMGNHEDMLLDALDGGVRYEDGLWLLNGGWDAVRDYVPPEEQTPGPRLFWRFVDRFPKEHEEFMRGLPLWHATPEFIFVHAYVPPDQEPEEAGWESLLWGREFPETPHQSGRVVIYGHTPVHEPYVTPYGINIDTGCGKLRHAPLSALLLPEGRLFQAT